MTTAQLRRVILGALHAITGSFEPWRELGEAIVAYLGPSVGMGLTERWERMGVLEMTELADALEVDSYHGKAAGPIRNRLMLEAGPVAVLVFPGGRGTADMAIAAANAGVVVIERSDPRTAVTKSATKGV